MTNKFFVRTAYADKEGHVYSKADGGRTNDPSMAARFDSIAEATRFIHNKKNFRWLYENKTAVRYFTPTYIASEKLECYAIEVFHNFSPECGPPEELYFERNDRIIILITDWRRLIRQSI